MQAVQVKMARAALGLTVEDLATEAGVPASAVADLERGEGIDEDATHALGLFLSAKGIELIEGDGVRAKIAAASDSVTVEQLTTDNDGGEG